MGHYRMTIEMDGIQFIGNWNGNIRTLEEMESLRKLAAGIYDKVYESCEKSASVSVVINQAITLYNHFETKFEASYFI